MPARGACERTMEIVYHIGANCTDDDRLLKTLLKNTDAFSKQGIAVPGPSRYRAVIRETIQELDGGTPASDTRNVLLDTILDDVQADRLVMSNWGFICVPARIFEGGQFYHLAEGKVTGLRRLFPDDAVELHMGLRNPATFIPAVHAKQGKLDFASFMNGVDPLKLRWSDLIARIRTAVPDVPLTVWCNEDTPLIWSQIIRELSGVDPMTRIVGGFDLLQSLLSDEGMTRFKAYLTSHPPQTEMQKRRIIAAFLEKFGKSDAIEQEIDLPGWTQEMIEEMTAAYDADVRLIGRMEGVTLLTP